MRDKKSQCEMFTYAMCFPVKLPQFWISFACKKYLLIGLFFLFTLIRAGVAVQGPLFYYIYVQFAWLVPSLTPFGCCQVNTHLCCINPDKWYSRLPISNPRVINRIEVEVSYLGGWLGPRFFPFVYQGYYKDQGFIHLSSNATIRT